MYSESPCWAVHRSSWVAYEADAHAETAQWMGTIDYSRDEAAESERRAAPKVQFTRPSTACWWKASALGDLLPGVSDQGVASYEAELESVMSRHRR